MSPKTIYIVAGFVFGYFFAQKLRNLPVIKQVADITPQIIEKSV